MPDINFIIDGKPQTAAPGETILSVARRMGLDIPTLCYNQKISRTTSAFASWIAKRPSGPLQYPKGMEPEFTLHCSALYFMPRRIF